MPRETIQHGRDYARITVAQSETTSEYEFETSVEEARQRASTDGYKITYSTKPHLDLIWSRPPSPEKIPHGEESVGAVQVSISLAPQDMQWRIDHLKDHPEDLEDFSTVYTERLTRAQINHFIRTLKRARDAAYGSDE